MDHNALSLAAPPSRNPSVLCVCAMLPLLAIHTLTLTLALLTMPKQIWRWKMIHHWQCTAVSAPSYRMEGQANSCLKSLYPYCCKDKASYKLTSPLASQTTVSPGPSNAACWSDSINNFHVQYILLFFYLRKETKDLFTAWCGNFLLNQLQGLTVCKTCNETCLTLPQGAVNPLKWIEFFLGCCRVLLLHDGLNDDGIGLFIF